MDTGVARASTRTDEAAEAQLESFITRREDTERRKSEGECREEELWQESVERYNAKRQAQLISSWVEYHEQAASRALANGQAIAARHQAQIEALLGNGHAAEERNGHHH